MTRLVRPIHLLMWTLLTGCTVGPDYKPPLVRTPETWSDSALGAATTGPAKLDEWWKSLSDPLLDELIERATRSNLDLKMAAARVRQARAQRGVVAGGLWPHATVGTGYEYKGRGLNKKPKRASESAAHQLVDIVIREAGDDIFDGSFDASRLANDVIGETVSGALIQRRASKGDSRAQGLYELGFDAGWEIDMFGGTRRSVEAAEAGIEAAQETQRDVLITLHSEVARNYVEARGFQQRIAIARQNINSQKETLELARVRFEGGYASELDVAQAEAQLATTRSLVPALQTSFHEAAHRLSVLLAEHPGAVLAELSEMRSAPLAPPEIPVGLPSALLRRRPDIRRSERQLAAATARIGVAVAELFPRLSITGSFGTQTRDVQHFVDGKSLFWTVGPSVSWPILDAARIRANIQLQDAVQQEAIARYELTVIAALNEAEQTMTAFKQAHEQYRYVAEAVGANQRAVVAAKERYVAGISDFLSVLQSQRSLYRSQDELERSEMIAVLNAIALYKALGGGWQ